MSSGLVDRVLRLLRDDFPVYLKSCDKKPILTQFREMIALYRAYHYVPYQYLNEAIYVKSFQHDPLDFLPAELIQRYRDEVNPIDSRKLVSNKDTFFQVMNANNIDIFPHTFLIHRSNTLISSDGNKVDFESIISFMAKSENRDFFIKPCEGDGGRKVVQAKYEHPNLIVDGRRINDMPEFIDALFSDPEFDEYIVQPKFIQHELLDRLNPASVNTVRIDTLIQGNSIANNGAFLRTSRGQLHVDSVSRGGLIIPIDLKTGTLSDIAHQWSRFGGETFREHPATNFRFGGTVLPFWPEIVDLVCSAAPYVQPLKSIGWDLAIGPDRPVILEANDEHVIDTLQIAAGGLRHTAIGQAVLQRRLSIS